MLCPTSYERVKRPQSEDFYSEELEQSTDAYYEFVVSIIEEMKKAGCEPLVMVEERVDYSHIAPSGFGTADMVIIGHDENGRGILHICDYKNGKGVFVDYNHNTQMMLYALGALHAYGYIYPIEIVRMSIIQPRLDNIGTCEMTADKLADWGESIRDTAKMAYEGRGNRRRETGAGSAVQSLCARLAGMRRLPCAVRNSWTWMPALSRKRRGHLRKKGRMI